MGKGVGSKMKRYINEFVQLKCAPDLLNWKLFPNAKEITESMGIFHAVKRTIDVPLSDNTVNLVCVGDGHTPRTAGLFAVMTNWNCYSIDPLMRDKWVTNGKIKRLTVIKDRIENTPLEFDSLTIIVLPHSHASLKEVLKNIQAPVRHLVVMACCVPQDIPNVPYIGYWDTQIWSEKNTIKIYLNI